MTSTPHSTVAATAGATRRRSGSMALFLCPVAACVVFRLAQGAWPGPGDAVVLLAIGWISGFFLASFYRGPRQFFAAVGERVAWILGLCGVLLMRAGGVLFSLTARLARIVIALIAITVYGLSPIDLIPDVLIGPGQIDDVVFALVVGWWALFATAKGVKYEVREKSHDVMERLRVTTPFP
jgi:hypothetical protein